MTINYASEIEALDLAIASGVTRVTYDGKSTDYDSFEKLLQRRAWLVGQQAGAMTGRRRPIAGVSSFDRGDR